MRGAKGSDDALEGEGEVSGEEEEEEEEEDDVEKGRRGEREEVEDCVSEGVAWRDGGV